MVFKKKEKLFSTSQKKNKAANLDKFHHWLTVIMAQLGFSAKTA